MSSTSIGIREAKANLSKLLKRIKEGQEVIITDRGRPVGRIISVSSKPPSLAERLKRVEEQGLLDPLPKTGKEMLPPPLPAPRGIAQKYLQDQRNA